MGGSSGGGGQGSDPVPEYLKLVHSRWLDAEGLDEVFFSVTDTLNDALEHDGNPFVDKTAYDPSGELTKFDTIMGALDDNVYDITAGAPDPYFTDYISRAQGLVTTMNGVTVTDPGTYLASVDPGTLETKALTIIPAVNPVTVTLDAVTLTLDAIDTTIATITVSIDDLIPFTDDMRGAICAYNQLVDSLHYTGDVQSAVAVAQKMIDAYVINDTVVANDVQAFRDILDDTIEAQVLPRFEGGMVNVNAVQSSAFVIGRAVIEAFHERDVVKYETGLREQLHRQRTDMIDSSLKVMIQHLQAKVSAKERVPWMFDALGKLRIAIEQLDLQVADLEARLETLKLEKARTGIQVNDLKIREAQLGIQKNDLNIRAAQIDIASEELKVKKTQLDIALVELRVKIGELGSRYTAAKVEAESTLLKPKALVLSAYELEAKAQSLRQSFYGIRQDYARLLTEAERIKIVAGQEEVNQNISIFENEKRWRMEQWQAAANVLAAYSGGTAPMPNKQPGQISSAIGGALSGAAVGGELGGGGWGAGVGAVLGAASAFL